MHKGIQQWVPQDSPISAGAQRRAACPRRLVARGKAITEINPLDSHAGAHGDSRISGPRSMGPLGWALKRIQKKKAGGPSQAPKPRPSRADQFVPLALARAPWPSPTCAPGLQGRGDRNGSEHAFRKLGSGYNAWKRYDFSVWLGRPRNAAKRRRGGRARARCNKY